MSILRRYRMVAKAGEAQALEAALVQLAMKVRPFQGCEGVKIMKDINNDHVFVFVEQWASGDDHKAAGKALGAEVFASIWPLLDGKPEASDLEPISSI
jgi:quinol monooxygenase YgiN